MDIPEPLPQSRPEPNGITPPLLFISITCMVVVPALTLYALSLVQLPPTGNKGAIGMVIGLGVYAVFSFFAGFSMYSGKFSGRNLVLWIALLGIVASQVVGKVFGIQNNLFFTMLFAGALFWLQRSEVCRNNYNPAYQNEPIRPPLSPVARYGWLAWGAVIAVAAVVVVFKISTAPDVFAQVGLSRIERGDKITITVSDEDITVPAPLFATHMSTEVLQNEGGPILLRFGAAGIGKGPYTMWTVSLPDTEFVHPITQEEFDLFRGSILHSMEEINDVRIDDHPEFFIITVKDIAQSGGEISHVTTSFGFISIKGVLFQCRMWRISPKPYSQEETAGALGNWMTTIYKTNEGLTVPPSARQEPAA